MKQICLHIGLHKTGSTYMQKTFCQNRVVLQRYGIEYPELGAEHLFGHHNVAWSFMPGRALENAEGFSLSKFATHLSQSESDHFLVSSEDFEFLHLAQVSDLQRLLADYAVKIVMYVRSPLNALYSRWQEGVKHGDTTSLQGYCEKLLLNPKPLNYFEVMHTWTKVFGQDAVTVVIYDNLVTDETDIALYFVREILEMPIQPGQLTTLEGRVNVAGELGVIEVLRHLNEIHQSRGHKELLTQPFMRFLRRHPRGRDLKKHAQALCDEESEFFDISGLDRVFSDISDEFLLVYAQQVSNLKTPDSLFNNVPELKIPIIRSNFLAERLPLEQLYNFLVS